MKIGIGTIIFLIIIAWQVISSIIAQSEKKKKQERMIKLAGKQRTSSGSQPQTQIQSMSTRSQATSAPGRTRSRAEELAVRRQAQLEELRRRRAGRSKTSRGQTQARAGMTTSVPRTGIPAPATVRPSKQIKRHQADLESIHLQQEKQSQSKAEQERKKLEQLRVAQKAEGQRSAAKEARMLAEREKFHRKAEAGLLQPLGQRESESAYVIGKNSGGVKRQQIMGRLGNRATLRELFILKELIDPPVAMRSSER